MAYVRKDIQERAFRFACDIVNFCESRTNTSLVQRRLTFQLLDAGTSLGANLEEAVAGQTKPDFIAKVFIALKEANEARFWMRLIRRTARHVPHELDALLGEIDELIAIITTIARNARNNPNRGEFP